MTRLCLGDSGRTAAAIGELHSGVAVGVDGLDLGDAVIGHVEHGHGDGISVVREDAHHAYLATQQAKAHGCFSVPDCNWPGECSGPADQTRLALVFRLSLIRFDTIGQTCEAKDSILKP